MDKKDQQYNDLRAKYFHNPLSDSELGRRREITNQAFNRVVNDLSGMGIQAERNRRTLKGKFKGEPFAVFLQWIRMGEEYAAELVVRYKGKDHHGMTVKEVLK